MEKKYNLSCMFKFSVHSFSIMTDRRKARNLLKSFMKSKSKVMKRANAIL
jgi:hypothetical protein